MGPAVSLAVQGALVENGDATQVWPSAVAILSGVSEWRITTPGSRPGHRRRRPGLTQPAMTLPAEAVISGNALIHRLLRGSRLLARSGPTAGSEMPACRGYAFEIGRKTGTRRGVVHRPSQHAFALAAIARSSRDDGSLLEEAKTLPADSRTQLAGQAGSLDHPPPTLVTAVLGPDSPARGKRAVLGPAVLSPPPRVQPHVPPSCPALRCRGAAGDGRRAGTGCRRAGRPLWPEAGRRRSRRRGGPDASAARMRRSARTTATRQ
jgi:hypothetical protein